MARDRPAGHLYGCIPTKTDVFCRDGIGLKWLAWCLMALLWTWQGISQPLLTVPYSLEDGLVQSQVVEIYQDKEGYLWFGTLGGVSRFDGMTFTNLTVAEGLASNRVYGLAEDHQGRIWMGTPKGITIYDGTSMTHLTTKDGLLDDEVYELLGLPSGDIWIASRSGLTYYDGDTFAHITDVDGLVSPLVVSLALDGEGNLWAGTGEGACILKNREPTCYTTDDGLPDNTVNDLMVDNRGRVWAGTFEGIGILLPGNEKRRFIALDYLSDLATFGFLQDQSGAIWISTRKGFFRVDEHMNITDRWDSGKWIGSTLYQDAEGTVWGGTYGRGLIQFRPTAFTDKTHILDLPEDVYLSIHEDPDSVIWVGTLRHGLFRIDGDDVEQFTPEERPFLNHIRSINSGPDSTLWITAAEGVIKYNENGFKHYSKEDGFYAPYSYSVIPDSNGTTWVGNLAGLFKIHQDSVSQIDLPLDDGGRTIHALAKVDGRIWIGAEEGLMYLDGEAVHQEEVLQGIPILSITAEESGKLWICTRGNGIYLFDPVSASLTDSISTQDGLNSGTAYFVERDHNNYLWVGTNKGINKIDLTPGVDREINVFGHKDGIVGVETNKNASMVDRRGRLWFGTLKGLMVFDSADEPVNQIPPPVYLTDVQLYLESIPGTDSLQEVTATFAHTDNHLTFHFLGLSFINPDHVRYQYQMKGFDREWSPITKNRFATYSNLPPGNYTFEVRARNSDGIWSMEPASISFSITPPYWEATWFKGLCIAGLLLFVIGVVQVRTYTIKKRSKQLQVMVKERTLELETTHTALLEAREEALQAAHSRSAFLSTMTHELRTPMNGIMGMAQLLNFTQLDEEQTDYSITILESSTAMLDMIENLLTFADLAAGKRVMKEEVFSIGGLIEESLDSINAQAKAKELEVFSYISAHLAHKIKADREHIRQIIKHLLSNAIKFTEKGLVYLEVDKQAKRIENEVIHELVISVHDTGIGIEGSKLTKIFDSFAQLDMTNTRSFEGTGIGLALARHMAHLLDGNVRAESKPGIGSSFYLSLPLNEIPQSAPSDKFIASPLAGKKVMIILQSERDRRRLALVCKSLEMAPELAKPSDLLGGVSDFDLVLSEARLENKDIHWHTQERLANDEITYEDTDIQGIVIEAPIPGAELEAAIHQVLASPSTEESSDFHEDFGNPMQRG